MKTAIIIIAAVVLSGCALVIVADQSAKGRRVTGKPTTLSPRGLVMLKAAEGFRPNAYQDSGGKWTIGYGHLIVPGDGFTPASRITETEAARLLAYDVRIAERAVRENVRVPISQSQFDALVMLTFNIGVGAFIRSSLLRALNAGSYQEAANHFMDWIKVQTRVNEGLVSRRNREANLFSGGDYA